MFAKKVPLKEFDFFKYNRRSSRDEIPEEFKTKNVDHVYEQIEKDIANKNPYKNYEKKIERGDDDLDRIIVARVPKQNDDSNFWFWVIVIIVVILVIVIIASILIYYYLGNQNNSGNKVNTVTYYNTVDILNKDYDYTIQGTKNDIICCSQGNILNYIELTTQYPGNCNIKIKIDNCTANSTCLNDSEYIQNKIGVTATFADTCTPVQNAINTTYYVNGSEIQIPFDGVLVADENSKIIIKFDRQIDYGISVDIE